MGFEVVEVPGLPAPGQFTHVAKKGKFVFISGQTAVPEAEAGNLDPMAQAERTFGYLKSAVEAAGGDMSDIVKINIFLTDLSQFPAILEWRPKYFDQPYPAATCVVVNSMVRRELIMEIEAIAILD
jgi:enamine deaminase RidA (YjgF/YER057c/UK114 family)